MKVAFKKAVKYGAKGRVALVGPAGSGKSFTALQIARTLVGPTGKIAAVDTEHGSLSKYAHTPKCGGEGVCEDPSHFEFDVIEFDSYSPDNFKSAMEAAIAGGYDAFVTDSLSHFWMGKDGALEFVDMAAKKSSSRDGMSGWKEFRPHERSMVDQMIAAPMHVVVTMRTKTEYVEQKDDRGKTKRVKVGLMPVQREGLEYEFDLVGLMTEQNDFIVDKSRCFELNGKVLSRPGPKEFAIFREWLSGEDAPPRPTSAQQPQNIQQPPQHPQTPPANGNGNGTHPFNVTGSRVNCYALNVESRTSRNGGKPFRALKMNGAIGGQALAFCWHASLFNAIDAAKNKQIQFEHEIGNDGKSINITAVLDIDGQEYRDGKPFTGESALFPEGDDPEEPVGVGVASRSAINSTEITDDDIPF